MSKLYDVIIIGGGPAGLTAGIYAKRACLETLLLEKEAMGGGQVLLTDQVDNYTGLNQINGFEMGMKFTEHAKSLGVEIRTAEVQAIEINESVRKAHLKNETLEAKALVIATGARHRTLNVPGEEALRGMGVSYCATCDGAFYKNKDVAVVGGGDVAFADAAFLARICHKVYLIHRRQEFRAAPSLQEQVKKLENVEFVLDSAVEKINGEKTVSSVSLTNVKTQEKKDIEVSGIFIAVGTQPNTELVKDIVELNAQGYIAAGENCQTSAVGVYAAGDVRAKELRQIITAAADGAAAIHSLQKDL